MQPKTQARIATGLKWLVVLAALLVIIGWSLLTPPGLLGKVDALGYAVCHRIGTRSFHIGSRQLPLCARCTGMYLGAMLGLAYQVIVGWKRGGSPPWYIITVLVLAFLAFGIDGGNSYLYLLKETYPGRINLPNLYVPNNILRLLTGSGMGLGLIVALFPAFNQTVWSDWNPHPALTSSKSFGLLLGMVLLLDLGVLTESPIILYPVTFISAGGVLVLLTMVYTMVWVMLMRQENTFHKITQMWLPLTVGLTIALIQITAIDAFRFWLTGTWGGFLPS